MVDHHSHVCISRSARFVVCLCRSLESSPIPSSIAAIDLPTSAFRVTTWPRLLNEKVRPLLVTVSVTRSRNSGTTSLNKRPRRNGPRHCRAAEQSDELAAPHSITSSARPSSGRGTLSPSALAVLRLRNRPHADTGQAC
jgi:hypothetical protein